MMVRMLAVAGLAAVAAVAAGGAATTPVSTFESPTEPVVRNKIDELVFARLRSMGIQPARPCSDVVFLRRVFLDMTGTLPEPGDVRQFLDDTNANKRAAVIDRLFERDEFVDYWTMKWGDLLRVKAEFPINLWPNSVQLYHRWIRTCVRDNVPYDRFARELLTSSGSNFRVAPVNFYRAVQNKTPRGMAQAAALTFLGERIENWPTNRAAGFEAFFSKIAFKPTLEWKEEIVAFDPFKTNVPDRAMFPDGISVSLPPDQDPREIFANWLIGPKNAYFARNIVNRQWSWLMGRGLIHEPDDIRPDNPASHPDVLALLEKELVASGYDLRHTFRLILNSQTYQLSSVPRSTDPRAETHFARYIPRRLDAEVLIDALCRITGTTEKYSSPIPEPFTFIPENHRSIALSDGSITSSFLELFGRPSRDTGFEAERNNRPTAAQALHLLNSSHVRRKLEQGPKILALLQGGGRNTDVSGLAVANNLYLTILSRYPTDDELDTLEKYVQSAGSKRDAAMDVVWSLVNSPEFLLRH